VSSVRNIQQWGTRVKNRMIGLGIVALLITAALLLCQATKAREANVVGPPLDPPSTAPAVMKTEPFAHTKRSTFYRVTDYDNDIVCFIVEPLDLNSGGPALTCLKMKREKGEGG